MKIKRLFSVVLGMAITLTFGINAYASNGYSPRDTDAHWAENEILPLMYTDIMRGTNSYANPNATITRGEFAALTARALSLTPKYDSGYLDVPKGHMFHGEISALTEANIIKGTGNNVFSPNENITREQIMLIIARTLKSTRLKSVNFSDIKSGYPYLAELQKAVSSGIITGFDDGRFRPYAKATRAECAVMLTRLLKSQDNISKSHISTLAEKYIKNEMSNIPLNKNISLGRALNENSVKQKTIQSLDSRGVQVKKLINNLNLTSYDANGAFATVTYDSDITYITTTKSATRQRNYKATYKLDIIQKGGQLYVYDYNLTLKKPSRINLTWEVFSQAPDYAPRGVNVVSPSSFQISTENLNVEKKELLGNIKFYNSLTRKYMNYAKENGYEVWPIYKTDFSSSTSNRFLNSENARQKAISYIVDYACKYLIDGINIDFENIHQSNHYLLTMHVRELTVSLHELGLIVSCDITRKEPTSANWSMCYNRDALSENTDYIMLIAYDEHYASSKKAGSVASLDWTEESIKRTLNEVDADKLILGIPFYMRYFETKNGKVTSSKAISMQTAYELTQTKNPTYTYINSDKQYKISWIENGKNCMFWLENSDTVKLRIELANKYSLAGVASWRRGLEIPKIWDIIETNLN